MEKIIIAKIAERYFWRKGENKIMRVKFMNQTVMLKNEATKTSNFVCNWNGYNIDCCRTECSKSFGVLRRNERVIKTLYGMTNTEVVQHLMSSIESDLNRIEKELKHLAQFRPYRPVHKCPFCDSKRLFRLRLDSDWASGVGDYYPLPSNDESLYTEEELKYDSFDRPDINVYHCLDCDRIFE